jgi:hypothetical protein
MYVCDGTVLGNSVWVVKLRKVRILLSSCLLFENRLLRIFRPKREEGAGGWRKLCNEEICNLYASPNVIRVIKSRRVRWVGHVAWM